MNRVTTKSPMRSMPTNVRLNWTPRTPISKPDCSCFATDKPAAPRRVPPTFIPRPTKRLAPLGPRDRNGLAPAPVRRRNRHRRWLTAALQALVRTRGRVGFLI